jgi:cytoskeletal protein RodZ
MEIEKKENESIQINEVIKIIGKKISLVRKESKQKIDKISKKLKIRSEFLVAIEEGNLAGLPEEVYLKGFIKSYANYFNLDIDYEMKILSNYYNESLSAKIRNRKKEDSTDSLPTAKVFAAVFIVFLIVIISWSEYQKSEIDSYSLDEEKTHESVSEKIINKKTNDIDNQVKINSSRDEITIVEEAEVANINRTESRELEVKTITDNKTSSEIIILFLDTTWIQIRKIDGSIVNSGIFEKEEIINIVFDERNTDYFIDTGNAGGFKLLSNNKELPLLGELGSVKKNVSLLGYFNRYNNMQ